MKNLLLTIIFTISVMILFTACNNGNEKDANYYSNYVKHLRVGDSLDTRIPELDLKEANNKFSTYVFSIYESIGYPRRYYITVDTNNIVLSIWTKK